MLLSVLLLLLLVCGTQAGFHGIVVSYTTKDTQVIRRVKFSFSSCGEFDSWFCGGDCSTNTAVHKIAESVGEWCQKEVIWSWVITSLTPSTQRWNNNNNWIVNINGITSWKGLDYEEMRNRSDIKKPNSSPQTNVLPAVRVPSNCQRNISLLTFDPDGDVLKCRYADGSECVTWTPPSVLSVSSSCTLSFSPTNSNNEGSYAVQVMMDEFPRQTITVADSSGGTMVISTTHVLSKIPIQFVFKVLPAVPSCSEGLYLPRFLPPTLENGAQFNATVNQTLIINIRAEATQSVITELLFSGPYYMVKNTSGSGTFTLTWKPSDSQVNESHPICFVVQASYSSSVYQSEHRCVLVTVGPPPPPKPHVFYLRMKITTTLSLMNNKDLVEKAIKDRLINRGMPSFISVRLLSNDLVEVTTHAPPSG